MTSNIRISKSIKGCYETCPQRYKLIYINKVPTETSEAAQRGLDVHAFAGAFYNHIKIENEELIIDPNFIEEYKNNSIEDSQKYIENFIDFEKKRWEICKQYPNPLKYFVPVIREKKVENIGLGLVGIVDRVDRKFNGNYMVIEIKTGKYDERSWKRTELRQELAFYKLLIESSNLVDKPIEDFAVYYPRSNDVWTETFNGRTLSAFQKNLEKVREGISRGDFHCNISIFCRYCEANRWCPMESN